MADVYPKEIIPQTNFLQHLDEDGLLSSYPNLAVSRRVEGNVEEAFVEFNGKKQLNVNFIGQVANMSLNLLGGLFEDDKHLCFSPLKEAIVDWEGQDVSIGDLEGKFSIKTICFPVYFYVKDIFDYPFTGEYYFQKEDDAMLFISGIPQNEIEEKYVEKFNKQTPIVVKTHAVLKHAPTNFNYWHFVLDSYPNLSAKEAIPSDCKGNAQKRIVKKLRADLITKFLKTDLTIDYVIDPKHYCA